MKMDLSQFLNNLETLAMAIEPMLITLVIIVSQTAISDTFIAYLLDIRGAYLFFDLRIALYERQVYVCIVNYMMDIVMFDKKWARRNWKKKYLRGGFKNNVDYAILTK